MALPYSEEPGPLPEERKKKALLRLIMTLLAIDTLAVIGYLVLVFVLQWEGLLPLGLLLLAAVFTGMYSRQGNRRLTGDFSLAI
jgi:hypothetical protein